MKKDLNACFVLYPSFTSAFVSCQYTGAYSEPSQQVFNGVQQLFLQKTNIICLTEFLMCLWYIYLLPSLFWHDHIWKHCKGLRIWFSLVKEILLIPYNLHVLLRCFIFRELFTICLNTFASLWMDLVFRLHRFISSLRLLIAPWHMQIYTRNGKTLFFLGNCFHMHYIVKRFNSYGSFFISLWICESFDESRNFYR